MSDPATTQPDPRQIQVDQLNNLRAMLELMRQLPVMTAELQAIKAENVATNKKLDQVVAENAAMKAELQGIKAENARMQRQLEIANKPVQSVWFKAHIKVTNCHAGAGTCASVDANATAVVDAAETDVKAQLAAWKAAPANARKLIVAEMLIPCDHEQFYQTHGHVYSMGFVYLHLQYKDL